jgi:hypothetical protein
VDLRPAIAEMLKEFVHGRERLRTHRGTGRMDLADNSWTETSHSQI